MSNGIKKPEAKKLPIKEVENILRTKYNVKQSDIDYLDDEFKIMLLEDMQSIPMLND